MIKEIKMYLVEIEQDNDTLTLGTFTEDQLKEDIVPQMIEIITTVYPSVDINLDPKIMEPLKANKQEHEYAEDTTEFDSLVEPKGIEEPKPAPVRKGRKPKEPHEDKGVILKFFESSEGDEEKAALKYATLRQLSFPQAKRIVNKVLVEAEDEKN